MKILNDKFQIPMNVQMLNLKKFKNFIGFTLNAGYWNLFGLWSLGFGVLIMFIV